jgi:eukaryotic-like serine/threonine-protein kinase
MTNSRDKWLKTGGAMAALPDAEAQRIRQLTGRTVGGYRITGLLGSGGMGLVMRAERAANDFERTVAIKLVPESAAVIGLSQRFQTERQILASLNHPGIAQLYDAGETEEGWPFLVMELVDGAPIDAWCRLRGLSTRERVALLVKVAEAVEFAHRRLVVHRDIKPSNVMVTREGRPKLLDFGIAKLLDPSAPQHTRAERLLTPQYASPEQLLGDEITTGSDIYQLGALLLAVLGDEAPFKETSLAEAVTRAAARREAVISRQARKIIPGDLIAIIEKCIRPDPDDRYSDAGAIRADLQNYLGGFPVSARQGARLYRARKLVSRNKAASLFAALATTITIGGSIIYTVQLQNARDLAEAKARTAGRLLTALTTMISDTYTELIETSGARRTADDAEAEMRNEPLRLVLERTDRLIADALTDEPELRGELLLVQGITNRELNHVEDARVQLKEALEIATAREDPDLQVKVLGQLIRLSDVDSTQLDARRFLDQGLAIARLPDISPQSAAAFYVAASSLERKHGNYESAAGYAREAVQLLDSGEAEPGLGLARACTELGTVYGQLERHEEMRSWLQKAVSLYERVEGPLYRGLQTPVSGIAWSHVLVGEYATAREYFLRELEIARANYGERHMRTALAYGNLGLTSRRMGALGDALAYLQDALRIYREVGTGQHQIRGLLLNLGNTHEDLGQLDEAAAHFEAALAEDGLSERDPRIYGFLLNNLGSLLANRGETVRSEALLREAVEVKARVLGESNISTARSRLYLAQLQIRTRQHGDIAEQVQAAAAAYEGAYGAGHMKMAFLLLVQAQHARMRGDYPLAMTLLEEALRGRLEEYDGQHALTAETLCELARTAAMMGDATLARSWLEQAAPALEEMPPYLPASVEAGVVAAEVLAAEGRVEELEQCRAAAQQRVQSVLPARNDLLARLAAL